MSFAAHSRVALTRKLDQTGLPMKLDASFISQLVIGNLAYVLLIISMLMTRMFWLRIFAIGAGLVGAIYTWFWLNDPISTSWEFIFVTVNIVQIALASYRNAMLTFSPEDRIFHRLMVPTLEPHQVRSLLKIAEWRQAEPGTRLIEQGVIASHLVFLRSGEVSILHEGKFVGSCGGGTLVAEISIANEEPATATVIVTERAHYLAIEKRALQKLKKSDPEIREAIENCSRESLRNKLVQMNVAAAGIR